MTGKIAFSAGTDDIYTVNPDGAGLSRLTQDAALEFDPTWSPDGGRIAYRREENGDSEIWAMSQDGSGAVNLTQNRAMDWSPAWSPDGNRIAFASDRSGSADLWA